jgi:P-type Cu+ transporter
MSLSCKSHPSPFRAHLYHPPTFESLSQAAQTRERQVLFRRLVLNVIVAIPTFLIGVVFTSLLPSQNSVRKYLQTSIWSGTTTRAVWALFILATPVQFYCSLTFHRKAIKEVSALWSPHNRAPIWKRFVRFGSMNLLMSLGISVSYFSSVVLLAISSVTSAAKKEDGMGTTYFDSVVFLSMFLLIGECHAFISQLLKLLKNSGRSLEACMRVRTADAVRSLARIRPQTALLLKSLSRLPERSITSTSTVTDGSDMIDSNEKSMNTLGPEGFTVKQVSADDLEVRDLIRVVPGGAVPADGTVTSLCSGLFDESMLTGESKLLSKAVGDRVYAGTICKSGSVDARVDKLAGDTMYVHSLPGLPHLLNFTGILGWTVLWTQYVRGRQNRRRLSDLGTLSPAISPLLWSLLPSSLG